VLTHQAEHAMNASHCTELDHNKCDFLPPAELMSVPGERCCPPEGRWRQQAPVPLEPDRCTHVPDAFTMRFMSSVPSLLEQVASGMFMNVVIFGGDGKNEIGRAQVPMSPLLSETWVQGVAKIWGTGTRTHCACMSSACSRDITHCCSTSMSAFCKPCQCNVIPRRGHTYTCLSSCWPSNDCRSTCALCVTVSSNPSPLMTLQAPKLIPNALARWAFASQWRMPHQARLHT
jgi:hypothetical protein